MISILTVRILFPRKNGKKETPKGDEEAQDGKED